MLQFVLTVVATVVVFGGLGGTVLAQEEADDSPVTHVTGTIVDTFYDDSTGELTSAPGDINHMSGATYVETNEWSDPRLPAEKRMVLDFTTYPYEGGRLMVTRTSIRMDGADGSWVGTGVGLSRPDGSSQGQDVLVGEGGYEGLFAVLNCGTATGCDGYIFEGQMPPPPDPVEPPAE
jgi:hypothetical protein